MSQKMTAESLKRDRAELEARYTAAKNAEIGSEIACPYCEKVITKRRYNTTFCSNVRTHGKHNCKDSYHNALKGINYHLATLKEYAEQ